MKMYGNSRILCRIAAMLAVLLLFGGCGAKTEEWAYDYEPEKTILSLSENGKAVYGGTTYQVTREGAFLRLQDGDRTLPDVRFLQEEDALTLYQKSVYSYAGEEAPQGLTGLWKQDNGWSFEFTADGAFCEEGYFYGHYSVDEAEGSIRLMYSDPIPDAILYYSLDGDKLTVDYPWPLVHTKKAEAGKGS
ncbi:MAG: hypothetical protein IKS07_10395 [Lachnospiraceae bacterium]|nr:hypothetical protein [Lachnospiraceae bacterium]